MFGIIPCHFLRGPVPTRIWVWFHIAKKLSPCNKNSSLGKKLVSCVLIHWFSNSLMFLNPSMSFFERKKNTLAFFFIVPTTIYIWFKCLQRISPCRKVNSVRKAYLKFMKFSSEKKPEIATTSTDWGVVPAYRGGVLFFGGCFLGRFLVRKSATLLKKHQRHHNQLWCITPKVREIHRGKAPTGEEWAVCQGCWMLDVDSASDRFEQAIPSCLSDSYQWVHVCWTVEKAM